MNYRELYQPPNLLSLARVALVPAIGFFLLRDGPTDTLYAGLLVILAGVTDALDGWLARKMRIVSELGVALDPIADKLFAIGLAVCLIVFREFPIWLAVAVVLRDLLILAGGAMLRAKRPDSLPPNLIGKWTFACLATLLTAHVIRFEFSIMIVTPIVAALLAASIVSYGRLFFRIKSGQQIKPFADRTVSSLPQVQALKDWFERAPSQNPTTQ